MGATVTQYPTPTLISGGIRELSATASTAASTTKVTIPALTVVAVTRRFSPEFTSSATTALPSTFDNLGWQMNTDIIALSDAGVTRASTIVVALRLQADRATTVVPQVALYVSGTLLGTATGASTNLVANTAATINCSVSVAADIAIPANGKIQLAVLTTGTNIDALNACLITLLYTATGTSVGALTYTINAARTGSDSSNQNDSNSRVVATSRTGSESTSQSDSDSRVVAYQRRTNDAQTSTATAIRQATYRPIGADSLANVTDTATRTQVDFRRANQNDTTAIDTAQRAVAKTITSSESTNQTDVASKTITYQRITLYQFQPQDEPASAQVRAIRGYVLNADHTPFTQGATVLLIREDGIVVQQTTTAQDGSYVFPRNFLDTHTYTVAAFATVGGSPYEAITQRGLVPV